MGESTYRPEPGIATDKEYTEAAEALKEALDDLDVHVEPLRDTLGRDRWDEVIRVSGIGDYPATKTTVVNDALLSDAPVRVRDLNGESSEMTFYPINQQA